MADGNPFAPEFMNPNASRTGLWDLRMMSAANRMETPFERGGRGMYRHQGVSGDPMISGLAGMAGEPDYSRFTFDPQARAQATQALSPYGLAPLAPEDVKRNAILPNTGYFGDHPRLSGALEGGIFGALAAHGGETPGESIQGALEGLVGGHRIQQGLYNQQFARPFEAASMMEQLQDAQQRRQLQSAQIKRYSDESDIQRDRVEIERQKNLINLDKINATRPVPVEGGSYVYQGQGGPPTIGKDGLIAPGGAGGWQFEAGPGAPHRGGAGTDFDRWVEMKNQERVQAGKKPLTSDEIMAARGQWTSAGVAPGAAAKIPFQNYQDAQREYAAQQKQLQTQYDRYSTNDPAVRKQVRDEMLQEYYMNWTSQSMAAESSGQKAPPFMPPNEQQLDQAIGARAGQIKQQMDQATADFQKQWPQSLEAPAVRGGKSSPKRGSQPAGSSPDTAIVVH